MILVTGAGGAVGSALVQELRAAGQAVRGGYHSRRSADRHAGSGADAVALDLADPATLPAALEGVDALFLLCATGPAQTRQELTMVAAARTAGVRRIVKLSVWRADERLTPIARLHRPVEEALEGSAIEWTFLRPNFYMQNFARQAADAIRTRGVIAQLASAAAISFVDLRDVARVAARVLTTNAHAGRIYDLTGPEALTYEEVAAVFSRALGTPVRFLGLSEQEARAGMLRRGLPPFHADALIEVGQAYRDGGADTVTSAVPDLTGRDPIDLRRFVRDHREAFA